MSRSNRSYHAPKSVTASAVGGTPSLPGLAGRAAVYSHYYRGYIEARRQAYSDT